MSHELSSQYLATRDRVLGYLNFSSGQHDPRFFSALDELFENDRQQPSDFGLDNSQHSSDLPEFAHQRIYQSLRQRLTELIEGNGTYRNAVQAQRVLELANDKVLPAYLSHHSDLLTHQKIPNLFNSFFVARVLELTLENLSCGDDSEVVYKTVHRLNSYLGHRPVAILESRKIEPYNHERVAPVPLYIKEAGAAIGPYRELISGAIEILQQTDADILRLAHFDPRKLNELAFDPRAYDFDHPINKRPNHHFGQWDEDSIDGDGHYHRFIVYEVILDAILARIADEHRGNDSASRSELMTEGCICLAGTILMGSGITGSGPGAHDSNVTLHQLVTVISSYRDQFYEHCLELLDSNHRQRIIQEAKVRRQPFGAARQDLNSRLNQCKAKQLVNGRLAMIYAKMGYADAAEEQTKKVPVASARMLCQVECLLDKAARAVAQRDLTGALSAIPEIMDCLLRGIACGAIVDPWNIIGFDGNYSLFPALENSVADHRVYELVDLMERIFTLCSRLWSEAAAKNQVQVCDAIRAEFDSIVQWWRKYAAHEVSSVAAVDAEEVFEAAQLVAQALTLWQEGGAAAGDIEFWAEHAELFDSPQAYSLVIEALMQRQDYTTSTALLIHWLSQSEDIPLQLGDSSFYELVFRWITEQKNMFFQTDFRQSDLPTLSRFQFWENIRKFHDFIEANAGDYWHVPEFEFENLGAKRGIDRDSEEFDEEESDELENDHFEDFESLEQAAGAEIYDGELEDADEDEDSEYDDLFKHAYDDVVYRDTTDDGFEGDVFDPSAFYSDSELEEEIERVLDRLEFTSMLAGYWAIAATIPLPVVKQDDLTDNLRERIQKRGEIFEQWLVYANRNRRDLRQLMLTIDDFFPLPRPGSDYESLLQYEQYLEFKETLLDQAIQTTIDVEHATRMLRAAGRAIEFLLDDRPLSRTAEEGSDKRKTHLDSEPLIAIFAALLLKDADQVEQLYQTVERHLQTQPLLYIPLSKGGDPAAIVRARVLQGSLLDLIRRLPALGLIVRTYDLTSTVLSLERKSSFDSGAVTEFDEIFEVGFNAMIHTLIEATAKLDSKEDQAAGSTSDQAEPGLWLESSRRLFDAVEMLTESMLMLWLKHSQTLRLSVMEKARSRLVWEPLVDFIKKYGAGLFTQQFLHYSNVRAILHQGVGQWLDNLEASPARPDLRLLDELGTGVSREQAVANLSLILEAVIENYNEYVDYNSTTTQSDNGECLYMFLDFLRLRSRYDRICWHLKPIIWAHQILISRRKTKVANYWRRSLTDRLKTEATRYLSQLEKLQSRYSMKMESIARRIQGRFSDQMQIDRLCSMVVPALEDPQNRACQRKMELLKKQAEVFVESTQGVGMNLPNWLAALENEVERYQLLQKIEDPELKVPVDAAELDIDDLESQMRELPRRPLFE